MYKSRTLGCDFQVLEHKGVNYLQTYCVKFGWITVQKICSQAFKSPEKVLTIVLMPSFAYSVFTLQNCTGTNTAAVGGWNQMRPFLRRLKHNQLHSPYSKVVVNMIPHLNVYVHIGEETFTWVSEAFGKIQRKKNKFPVSSSIFPLCLLWWRWTVLMHYLQCCWECPRAKRKQIVGKRTAGAELILWRHSEELPRRGSHGFPWHHSNAGTGEAFGG